MRFYRPLVQVPGDDDNRIMARSGEILGYDAESGNCLWRFGFMPSSPAAEAYNVSVPQNASGFLWVLADRKGTALDTFTGYALNLPKEYEHVLQAGEPVDETEEADPYDV